MLQASVTIFSFIKRGGGGGGFFFFTKKQIYGGLYDIA